MAIRSLVGLSTHSAFHWQSAHCATRMLLLSDQLMSCCVAGTNGCLGLRRHELALNGEVSAEWSRCPGSIARHARDSVVPLRRSSAGWMPARIGRLSAGGGPRHPVTIRKASLMAGSIRRVWVLRNQTSAQYVLTLLEIEDLGGSGCGKSKSCFLMGARVLEELSCYLILKIQQLILPQINLLFLQHRQADQAAVNLIPRTNETGPQQEKR